MSQLETYRHEVKYFISQAGLKILSGIFADVLEPDSHGNEYNEYWIRSLYFDSMDNVDYFDKMSGTLKRKKIRMRIYDLHQKKIKLEIKNKFSDYILKEISFLDRSDASEIINGNIDVLLKANQSVLNRIYYFMQRNYYRPVVLVEYEREAYVSSLESIRITIDKNIRSNSTNLDLFDPNVSMNPVFDHDTVVLEVKFNRFLPHWIKEILKNISGERYAISKYCLSRHLFY